MPVAVVLAFIGVLVAAVGTGSLMGRLIRAPRSDLAVWACVLLALAVALGAQTMGFADGFSDAAFRAVAISGLLAAPLWTAWGLVELAGRSLPARFAARLMGAAFTVVPGVILALDPLSSRSAGGKTWPGETRYMELPRTALTAVHVIAVAIALLMMTLAALRTRRDAAWWDAFVPAAAAGAAVLLTVSLGLALPDVGYPLLTLAAAGSVWFAANRSARVNLDRLRLDDFAEDESAWAEPMRRHGRPPMETMEPVTGFSDEAAIGDEPIDGRLIGDEAAWGHPGDELVAADSMPTVREPEPTGREPDASAGARREPPAGAVTSKLFGLIAIYTLIDGSTDEFDRLAERTVEAVRRNEPDTLLFVVHTVPKAPMQRIFYEVYRDRIAYAEHRHRREVEEFFAMHRPYVLATNVIELDLQYAKASGLPLLPAMFSPTMPGDRP